MIRTILARAASGVDLAVTAAVLARSKRARARSRSESLGHGERMQALGQIQGVYDRPEHFTHPSPFFPPPPPPSGVRYEHVRPLALRGERGEVADVSWPSGSHVFLADLRERYEQHEANRDAAARLLLHERPRPAVILVHGYRAGQYPVEERAWPIRWLLDRGLDVAIAVLPLHGVRATSTSPLFPSSDPRFTIEGFRQAMFDLGSLARLLRDRGAPAVGMMGMSLGGYTTALAATVLDDLAFAVPLIPLASIADFARDAGRLVGTPGSTSPATVSDG